MADAAAMGERARAAHGEAVRRVLLRHIRDPVVDFGETTARMTRRPQARCARRRASRRSSAKTQRANARAERLGRPPPGEDSSGATLRLRPRRAVYETLSMYEKSFGAISERYFKASAWPSVEAIAKYADDDHVFCLLYKEMYFRHVYGKATPTLEQRCESGRSGTTTPTCSP